MEIDEAIRVLEDLREAIDAYLVLGFAPSIPWGNHTLDVQGFIEATKTDARPLSLRQKISELKARARAAVGGAIPLLDVVPENRRPEDVDKHSIFDQIDQEIGKLRLATVGTAGRRDDLTGLLNRGAFDMALAQAVRDSREGRPVALLMADIDHFKRVNDTHGHQTGDVVLREVAELLMATVAGKGKAYRYGGEEMAIILENHSAEEALAVAERIRRGIEARPIAGVSVTMSFGVACLPDHAADGASLVREADKALYDAKNRGRNLVRKTGDPAETPAGAREPERKVPPRGRLTETQKNELRRQFLRGERVFCPADGSLLKVTDVSTVDDVAAGRREYSITCPDCALHDVV